MRRGAVSKREEGARLVNFWIPESLLLLLDQAVRQADLDRAKFIRSAIREKAARQGVILKEAA